MTEAASSGERASMCEVARAPCLPVLFLDKRAAACVAALESASLGHLNVLDVEAAPLGEGEGHLEGVVRVVEPHLLRVADDGVEP